MQPPEWLVKIVHLETDPLEFVTLRIKRAKKVPDIVGGFNLGNHSIKTRFTEVAKAQGPYTSTSTTNQTLNSEGVLNKVRMLLTLEERRDSQMASCRCWISSTAS